MPWALLASNCSLAIRSACSWNSDFWLSKPISKQPLGAELPRRVPWPPAINTTATLFSATCFKPASYQVFRSAGSESMMEAVAEAGRGSRVAGVSSVLGGLRAFSASSLMRATSKVDSWWNSRDLSAVWSSSTKAKTCPCPASVYFFCRAWNSSVEGSRGASSAVPAILLMRLETVSLIAAIVNQDMWAKLERVTEELKVVREIGTEGEDGRRRAAWQGGKK